MSQDSMSAPTGRMPALFAYIRAKAQLYCKIGAVNYAKANPLRKKGGRAPSSNKAAILRGMEQIAVDRGWDVSVPLENIGIDAFYDLCDVLHFRVTRQAIASTDAQDCIDEMFVEHVVTGETISLFNKVPLRCAAIHAAQINSA
jgi:hypothetical protein